MLLHAGTDRQHVWVKDDIFRWKPNFVDKDIITPLADPDFVFFGRSLTFLVKRHHYNSCSVLLQQSGLLLEQLLPDLQRYRVYNTLALTPLQTSNNNFELGRIQHERNLRYLGFSNRNLYKLLHCCKTVKEPVVNVNVDNMSPIFHLLLRNIHGRAVISRHHELLEPHGSTDIAPFANIEERQPKVVCYVVYNQVFQSRQPHLRSTNIRELTRFVILGHLPNRLDVRWCRSTTSSHHVQPPILEEHLVVLSHVFWGLVVPSHRVRKTSVTVNMHETFHALRQTLHERGHVLCTKSTVQTNTHGLCVTNRRVESLSRLA
mmetsp:Transcript_34718/g.51586  ORF Transcript_34718/g.51586 Transcript_34718/m.51586 type:complete len:318 (+) Transcript_34718:1780-2733(+)